jgi:hypothetical protein
VRVRVRVGVRNFLKAEAFVTVQGFFLALFRVPGALLGRSTDIADPGRVEPFLEGPALDARDPAILGSADEGGGLQGPLLGGVEAVK